MELPLDLDSNDKIVSAKDTGTFNGKDIIRIVTNKGAIIVLNATLEELVVTSNYGFILNGNGLKPDYSKPNLKFVDVEI